MRDDRHAIEVCHAATGFSPVTVYAHCVCGWTSGRYRLTGTELDGTDVAILTAEHAGQEHVELASSSGI